MSNERVDPTMKRGSKVGRWVFARNGNAVASLLLALAGLPGFGVILGPIAIGLGLIALRQIRQTRQPGAGTARAGIAVGTVAFVYPIVLAVVR